MTKTVNTTGHSTAQPVTRNASGAESRYPVKRRDFLTGVAGIGTAALSGLFAPAILGSKRSIKIATFGGYFEDSFIEHIYPVFTQATGIEVESVTQGSSAQWLQTLQQTAKAGIVPADLALYETIDMIRAHNIGELLKPFAREKIPNARQLSDIYLYEGTTDSTRVTGVGAMAWYASMVVNTDYITSVPAAWAEFWGAEYKDSLGMYADYKAGLLDITAAAFFDGATTLTTRDGIRAVVDKISELKPNVKLWYSSESVMETALQNAEVIAGMYYHDVAGIMAADGFPIVSVFPEEGNVVQYGSWCLSAHSDKSDEAHEFVNFSCDPAIQALMARKIGTAPLVDRSATDLSDAEFAAVSSEQAPIVQAHETYLKHNDFIKETWDKMLTG